MMTSKTMKAKLTGLVFLALVCASCATQRLTPEEKQAQREHIAQMVADSLNGGRFKVMLDYVLPLRMPPHHLTSPYEVALRGDTLRSYLPYFGVVYSVPYGGGEGLNFDAHINSYQCQQVKRDMYRVEVVASRPDDIYVYTFDIYNNGKAELKVTCRNRDLICFTGEMDLDWNKQQKQ